MKNNMVEILGHSLLPIKATIDNGKTTIIIIYLHNLIVKNISIVIISNAISSNNCVPST